MRPLRVRPFDVSRDRQFLPAALEVLETPSSPTRRALLLTLSAFVAIALTWAFVGQIDIEAVAKGKVEPSGRVKVIEPLEPGRVASVLVEDGAVVKAGDQLVVLDPVEVRADENAAAEDLAVDLADAARYRAALAAVDAALSHVDTSPTIAWDEAVPDALRTRERQALVADLINLAEQLANLDMQAGEKRATIARLDQSLKADAELVATLQQHADMRDTLRSHGTGSKADYLSALQDLQRAQTALVADQGQRGEAEAALGTLASDKAKALSQFASDSANKLEDASNKAAVDVQTVYKARARLQSTVLRSPVDGVVQKLAVTSVGQVVTTGQELMIVVPSGHLEIEAFIDNIDIGFVKAGQEVAVKLDAFPFTRYGTIKGKVVRVATDALDQDEARRMQANATSLANSSALSSGSASQDQKFVFPITIALDRSDVRIGDALIPLGPGMSVTAEIKTDRQRIIDYLLSPLTQTASEAMHER